MATATKISVITRKPWDDPTERAEIYVFNPDEARYLLSERNPGNRPCNPAHVGFLKNELTSGWWRRNGETIIFDRQGNLKNGQHRLAACAESGVPLDTWCVFGVEPDVFDTLDRTRRRSFSDDLFVIGEVNCTALAAAVNLVLLEERGQLDQVWVGANQHVLEEVLSRHPRIRAAVSYIVRHKSISRLMPARVASYSLYRFSEIDHDAAYEFFGKLATGESMTAGNPILLLRERLVDNKTAKAKLPPSEILALVIKSWNAWRSGETRNHLRWRTAGSNPERFPVPR